jgi:8-oxo-dGTP diphosphatase
MDEDAVPLIDVACAALLNARGEVLMAQRPAGKIAAGYWEFPGGKIEPGETVAQALARELAEELGVDVVSSAPLCTFIQPYTDRRVRLHTHWVPEFRGAPAPREGQQLAWLPLDRLDRRDPHLPSVGPIALAMAWPPHYAFTAAGDAVPGDTPQLPIGGLVRLRQPGWSDAGYADVAPAWVDAQRRAGWQPVLDRLPELAATLRTPFHATEAFWRGQPRPDVTRCLASVHDAGSIAAAIAWGADALVLGQVAATPSHADRSGLGWPAWSRIAADARVPVYAIGGLLRDDAAESALHGAHGLAGIRLYR